MAERHTSDNRGAEGTNRLTGENLAFLLFCATTVHLALMTPDIHIIPGERARVFSGLLCLLSLVAAVAFGRKGVPRAGSGSVVISLVLAVLIALSSLFSATPAGSFYRGFVIAGAGLGGFWCARIWLHSASRQHIFQWLCLFCLSAVILLTFGAAALRLPFYDLIDSHWHPVISRVFLLSFAPLALLWSRSRGLMWLGIVLLILSYGVLFLGARVGMGSPVVIPLLLLLLVAALRELAWKQVYVVAGCLLAGSMILVGHFIHQPGKISLTNISVAYRIENIFFSWHIATKHPLLGQGLWTPRDTALQGYTPSYPHVTKEKFVQWTGELRTSENTFLTFMADLGLPFVILYAVALAILLVKLVRMVFYASEDGAFHPLVLLLPLTAELIHFQSVDGPFHPQVSWFFHILLGMIPTTALPTTKPAVTMRGAVSRLGLLLGSAALGMVLGCFLPESVTELL